jgi:hypothetical protein
MKQSPQITLYCLWLKSKSVDYVLEYTFHPKRKWRADIAIPSLNVLIEYEGISSRKSRHTTITGFSNDCEKYNQAQLIGWKVLRYTVVNKSQFFTDIETLTDASQ